MLKKYLSFVASNIGRCRYANIANDYTYRTHTCGELRLADVGKTVRLCGWLYHQRLCKFLVVRDAYGTIQVFNGSKCVNLKSQIESLSYESVLQIDGKVSARPPKDRNPKMPTGDVEIQLENLTVLNPSNDSLPICITAENYQTPNELHRFQYRYLDLRRHAMQHMLRFRANLIHKMRNFLESRKFVEVETPTLFRRTPGGAAEFIVPSSDHPGQFYCLPQSPQQFKQLLMVGGLDRYYQIARCYRDEGARADRQPEFSQLDIELSFTTQTAVMQLVQDVIVASWPDDGDGGLFDRPTFDVMTYETALRDYGSDKPDARYDMKLRNDAGGVSIIVENSKNIIDSHVVADWRHDIREQYRSLDSNFYCFQRQTPSEHWAHVCDDDADNEMNDLSEYCNRIVDYGHGRGDNNDNATILLSIHSDRTKACKTMGMLRKWSADLVENRTDRLIRDPKQYRFLWIVDFPLFLPKENGGDGFESAHHPFTAPIQDHVTLLYGTDPSKVTGQHYDLVLNGVELGGGSIRIHDATMQRFVLERILKEENVASMNHLMEALDSGAPPHGGFAIGLDRYIATLLNLNSIRDVIAFPKTAGGKDLTTKAPTSVTEDVLKRYHIKLEEKFIEKDKVDRDRPPEIEKTVLRR